MRHVVEVSVAAAESVDRASLTASGRATSPVVLRMDRRGAVTTVAQLAAAEESAHRSTTHCSAAFANVRLFCETEEEE